MCRIGRRFALTSCALGNAREVRISCQTSIPAGQIKENSMAFYAFYGIAIVVLILHFTGWLKRNRLDWMVLVVAAAVFPVVIFLR